MTDLWGMKSLRFAQDDGFVGDEKLTVSCAENTTSGRSDEKGYLAV
jgi:hypothetical protein